MSPLLLQLAFESCQDFAGGLQTCLESTMFLEPADLTQTLRQTPHAGRIGLGHRPFGRGKLCGKEGGQSREEHRSLKQARDSVRPDCLSLI